MDTIDVKQLTALVTVAEVGSITKAARLLRLAQPTVTRQIRLLENELGSTLFQRSRQGMVPTTAGDIMVDRARRALVELERARAELRPTVGGVTGSVTVGLLESVVEVLGEPLVTVLRSEHPGIEVRVVTAYSGHLQQWLDAGDVDMTLAYNLASTPALSVVPILDEELWAVAPVGSNLERDSPVSATEVLTQPLVLPVPGHGLRVLIDHACVEASITPTIAVQVNSMRFQKSLVAAGHGWSLLPASGVAADVAAGLLEAAPLQDPKIVRQVALSLPRAARVPPAVDATTQAIGKVIHRLVEHREWPGATLVVPQGAD